jgi:hypothetical protein
MKLLDSIVLHYIEHGEEAVCHGHPTKTDVVNRCIKELELILNAVEWPEVGTDQLLSIAVKNLTNTAGAVSIDVSALENPVALGTLQLRDNSGDLEISDDNGVTWSPVGGSGVPSAVANPVSLGGLLLYNWGAGSLRVSADNGSTYTPVMLAGDLPGEISNPITLGTLQLRDNAGVLEVSDDNGSTWSPVINSTPAPEPVAVALTLNPIHPTPSIEIPLTYGNANVYIRSDTTTTSDPIVDQTGNVEIVLHGTPTHAIAQAKYGDSSIFFPQGTYLEIDDPSVNPLSKDFLFMGWVYLPEDGHQKVLVLGNAGFQLATQYPSGGFLYLDTGYGDATGTVDVCDAAWHHVAVLRTGGTVKVAVDGVEDISVTIGADKVFDSNVITFGNVIGGGSYGINDGYLDDIFYKVGTSFYTSLPITAPGYIYEDAVFNGILRFAGEYV